TLLFTHAPLDLVILMLGSNDMKPAAAGNAVTATQGMRRLVEQVQTSPLRDGREEPPAVLLVAPPPIRETADPLFAAMFAGAAEGSRMLASLYADLADETGCGF